MIKRCSCKNEYQDKRYGQQMRVHNEMRSATGRPSYRCTVCGKVGES